VDEVTLTKPQRAVMAVLAANPGPVRAKGDGTTASSVGPAYAHVHLGAAERLIRLGLVRWARGGAWWQLYVELTDAGRAWLAEHKEA
jgi:hypothetical protein